MADLIECEIKENQPQTGFEHALGTIGGGNHFAEMQKIDAIFDEEAAASLGLNKKNLVLPAAGSPTSAFRIAPERIVTLARAVWVDVCQT